MFLIVSNILLFSNFHVIIFFKKGKGVVRNGLQKPYTTGNRDIFLPLRGEEGVSMQWFCCLVPLLVRVFCSFLFHLFWLIKVGVHLFS